MTSSSVALLAWELGEGLCHARRLLRVATALKARGWSPVVAARELWACTDEYQQASVPLIQAPWHKGTVPPGTSFSARSFADMMAACGYQDTASLWPTVVGWDHLIDLLRPAIIVADYAPILALAAFGRVPVVTIGDGFVAPPAHLPAMPRFRARGTAMATEPEMLARAAEVQGKRGYETPSSLPALIGGKAQVTCTFPETDIYADCRLSPATGPLELQGAPTPYPDRPAFFAYLDGRRLESRKMLQALVNSGLPVEAFVRNCGPDLDSALRRSGVTLHTTPPPLADVLAGATMVVHHGGIGTIETCLALGRPQVLLPSHTEQSLNCVRVSPLGVTILAQPSQSVAELRDVARTAASCATRLNRAQDVASAISARGEPTSLQRILEACECASSP